MALQQEFVKTAAVVALGATSGLGAPLLPAATTVALLAIQAFSLIQVLLTPPSGKSLGKDGARTPSSAARWFRSTWPSMPNPLRYALCCMVAIAFARVLRSMGLSGSLFQVLALACLGGAFCQACMVLASRCRGSAVACCIDDPSFWPALRIEEEEEQQQKSSPLSTLAEEYYSPTSMLSCSSFLDTEVSAEQEFHQSAPLQQVTFAETEAVRSDGISRPLTTTLTRCASCLILAIAFARGLRSLGLSSSLLQVLVLACLGGAICQAGMMLASRCGGSAAECCTRSPMSWPALQIDEVEGQEKSSPLSSLAEEYYSPNSMLSASSFLDVED